MAGALGLLARACSDGGPALDVDSQKHAYNSLERLCSTVHWRATLCPWVDSSEQCMTGSAGIRGLTPSVSQGHLATESFDSVPAIYNHEAEKCQRRPFASGGEADLGGQGAFNVAPKLLAQGW